MTAARDDVMGLLAFVRTLLAAVQILLRASGPAAIVRAIALIVVYPIEGMGRRWLAAHISNEVSEGMTPASTDSNTAPAIVRVLGGVGVVAPVQHGTPRDVFGRAGISRTVTMFGIAFSNLFSLQTTATLTTTDTQGSRNHDAFRTAGAPAFPVTLVLCHVGEAQHRPSSKSLPSFIDAVRVSNVHANQYTPSVVQ